MIRLAKKSLSDTCTLKKFKTNQLVILSIKKSNSKFIQTTKAVATTGKKTHANIQTNLHTNGIVYLCQYFQTNNKNTSNYVQIQSLEH